MAENLFGSGHCPNKPHGHDGSCFAPTCICALWQTRLAAAEKRAEEAERERDELAVILDSPQKFSAAVHRAMAAYHSRMAEKIDGKPYVGKAAEARIAALTEALEPFAELNERLERDYPGYADHVSLYFHLTHGHFRKAAAALQPEKPAANAQEADRA